MIAWFHQNRDVRHGKYSFSATDSALVPIVVDTPSQDDEFSWTSKKINK